MSDELQITIGFNEETSCLIRDFISQLHNNQLLIEINKKLDKLIRINKELKSMNQQTIQLLNDIDAASNELAADIQVLIDKANTNGSATAEEINAALAPKVAFLKQLAADTNAPVPEVPAPTEPTA